MEQRDQLIADIEQLLNEHKGGSTINPTLLAHLSENELKDIIKSLLLQKEHYLQDDAKWLEEMRQTLLNSKK